MLIKFGKAKHLTIFVDESGTMPREDSDGCFGVAAVGTTFEARLVVAPNGFSPTRLPQIMTAGKFRGGAAFVIPRAGFSRSRESVERGLFATVARIRRKSGRNSVFVPERGLSWANHVWASCAETAVAFCITAHVQFEAVGSVEIVFDQKTMAAETRRLVESQARMNSGRLFESLGEMHQLAPKPRAEARSRLRFGPNDILVRWSDGRKDGPDWGGLKLADRVAAMVVRELDKTETFLGRDPAQDVAPRFWTLNATNVLFRAAEEVESANQNAT